MSILVAAGRSDHPINFRFTREAGFPYWTFALFHKGSILINSRGQRIVVQAYDLHCMKPDTPYQTQINPGSRFWQGDWILGDPRPEWVDLMQWPEVLPGLFSINIATSEHREQIKNNFYNAVLACQGDAPHAQTRALHALESVLLDCQGIDDSASTLDPRIIKAVEILSSHFDHYMDVELLAERVGYSPSRLAHVFREQIGESPMSYREAARLRQAKQLLLGTNMTIQEIATAVFYDNPFHFSKRFKQRIGCAPKHFRQRMHEPSFFESMNSSTTL